MNKCTNSNDSSFYFSGFHHKCCISWLTQYFFLHIGFHVWTNRFYLQMERNHWQNAIKYSHFQHDWTFCVSSTFNIKVFFLHLLPHIQTKDVHPIDNHPQLHSHNFLCLVCWTIFLKSTIFLFISLLISTFLLFSNFNASFSKVSMFHALLQGFFLYHKFDIVTGSWLWFSTIFDIVTMISSWFLRDFSVIFPWFMKWKLIVTWP